MLKLVCPECDKLLGMATQAFTANLLHLWCRRCKKAVTPTVSRESRGSDQEG